MAEILVFTRDVSHLRGGDFHDIGDVIAIYEDGHKWARRECPPHFQVLIVPGVPPADFADLMEVQHDDADPKKPAVRNRKRRIDLDAVLSDVQDNERTAVAVGSGIIIGIRSELDDRTETKPARGRPN